MSNDVHPVQEADPDPIEATLAASQPKAWICLSTLAAWTVVADLTLFRSHGFSGPALFFAVVPLFFLIPFQRSHKLSVIIVSCLLWIVAAKLAFSGTAWLVVAAVTLTAALAMAWSGVPPLVMETLTFCGSAFVDGFRWCLGFSFSRNGKLRRAPSETDQNHMRALSLVIPAAAILVFGSIFISANPNLSEWTSLRLSEIGERVTAWLEGVSVWELPFCVMAFAGGAGLLFSVLPKPLYGPPETKLPLASVQQSPLYAAYRNTLVSLIALFGIYLAFEFSTLWWRDFPDGFYYAGYAHHGAAWLTVALALATGLLSLVFSGSMRGDQQRLPRLKQLAWIWSAQNFLLAAAVYNRLAIYVGYNGMTRLRTVGFFGITVVVVGFILVLIKITHRRSFWWLIRGQLIALALTIIAYLAFPVDYVAHRYNTNQVASGYLHPAVMIAVKEKDDSGVLPMLDLVNCDDPIIREGVRAMLAQQMINLEQRDQVTATRSRLRNSTGTKKPWHWTRHQAARSILQQRLIQNDATWRAYYDGSMNRADAMEKFRVYAMQWY
ncbi:MAG: DUF4153 domain-containing protein [Rubripirellula sp.]